MPHVTHVGLNPRIAAFDLVAEETFVIFADLFVQKTEEAFEIDEVTLFGDEHTVELFHVGDAEFHRWRVVVTEQATGEQMVGLAGRFAGY